MSKNNCTESIFKGQANDTCQVGDMCDKANGLQCLHYTVDQDGKDVIVQSICGNDTMCDEDATYQGSEVKIECGATKNVVSMIAVLVALYIAM